MKNVLKLTCLVAALVVAFLPLALHASEQAPGGFPPDRVFTGSNTAPRFMRFREIENGPGGDPGNRYAHTATLLNDGRVLVAGGTVVFVTDVAPHGDAVSVASAILYDPDGGWIPTGSMRYTRSGHTATLLPDGRVRVDGPSLCEGCPAEIYDPTSGTWSIVPAPPVPTARAASDGTVPSGDSAAAESQPLIFRFDVDDFDDHIIEDFQPSTSMLLADGTVLGFDHWSRLAFYDEEIEKWRNAGRMVHDRRYETMSATLLQSGEVLVMGGFQPSWGPEGEEAEIGSLIPTNTFTATLVLSSAPGNSVSFSGQTSEAPLVAAALSNDGETWSDPIAASAGVTVTAPWEYGQDVQQYVHLRLTDSNGNVVTVVKALAVEPPLPPIDETPPTGSIVINRGATTQQGAIYTTSRHVFVAHDATDEGSAVTRVRTRVDSGPVSLSNDSASPLSLDLGPDNGMKSVTVEFIDIAGNISLPVTDTILLDTSQGNEYGVAVNGDALWTNSTAVTVTLPAFEGTAEMQLSNGGTFSGASWEPYSLYRPWEITSFGTATIPRIVYVRFRDTNGVTSHTFQDDIILDQQAPASNVLPIDPLATLRASTVEGNLVPVRVQWAGLDDVSGIKGFDIQVQTKPGAWTDWLVQTSDTEAIYQAQPDSIVRFRSRAADFAGNVEAYPSAADTTVTVGTPEAPDAVQIYLPQVVH